MIRDNNLDLITRQTKIKFVNNQTDLKLISCCYILAQKNSFNVKIIFKLMRFTTFRIKFTDINKLYYYQIVN